MLVNSKKMLAEAKLSKDVIFQFNINNLEWTKYILETMNELNKPVILGVSHGAIEYMGGYNVVVALVKSLLEDLNIKIDVCLHLDHGKDYKSCVSAIEAGFTYVMIDASKFELEKNIEITKKVVDYGHLKSITVEGEVGTIGGSEDGITSTSAYAKYEDVIKFVQKTKVDSVAPAIGSVHGLYKGKLDIDIKRLNKISSNLKIPLVLHGGSGIPDSLLKDCVINGITKININTQLQVEWASSIRNFLKVNLNAYDPRKIISSGEDSIKKIIKDMVTKF